MALKRVREKKTHETFRLSSVYLCLFLVVILSSIALYINATYFLFSCLNQFEQIQMNPAKRYEDFLENIVEISKFVNS